MVTNTQEQKKITEHIGMLQLKGDVYTRQMVSEQRRTEELDEDIRKVDEAIQSFRVRTKAGAVDVLNLHRFTANPAHSRADGLDPTKQADRNQKKLVSILEARLNKMLIRHSEIVNENMKQKGEIDHMRKKRLTSDRVHAKFESDIKLLQDDIAAYMDRAAVLNEEREDLMKGIEEISESNRCETQDYEQRSAELDEYVAKQNEKFEQSMLEATKACKAVGEFSDVGYAGTMSQAEEEAAKNQLKQLEMSLKAEHDNGAAIEDKQRWYQEAFGKLKTASGIDDLDRLVTVFMKQEDEHFSLFNYIQSVITETEQTQEKTEELEREIKAYEAEQLVEEEQRVATIADLKRKLSEQQQARDDWEQRAASCQIIAEKLAKRVQSIFFKIQCDQFLQMSAKEGVSKRSGPEGLLSMLSVQGITESNMLDFMSVIEQRSIQVITAYSRRLALNDPASSPVSGPGRPPSWEQASGIEVPDVPSEDDDDDMQAEKPMSMADTRKEMEARLARKTTDPANFSSSGSSGRKRGGTGGTRTGPPRRSRSGAQ